MNITIFQRTAIQVHVYSICLCVWLFIFKAANWVTGEVLKKRHHVQSMKKHTLSKNGDGVTACPSKHGIFSIEDFVHIALVRGLFYLLAQPVIQELRKSLIFHTICCNSSLLQLQIIPPSTAESDNSDKQPIASCLGLPPDTLKLPLPSFTTGKSWQIEHNIFKTYPSASINSLSNRLEGVEQSLVFNIFMAIQQHLKV